MIEDLEAELAVTHSEIERHKSSMEWAFAMGHGCSMDGSHPLLCEIRDRVDRLCERRDDIKAQLAEFQV